MSNESEERLVEMFAPEIENCLELDGNDEVVGLDVAGVKSVLRSAMRMAQRHENFEVNGAKTLPMDEEPTETI